MVPRSEYLGVQAQLADSIPRSKFEEEIQRFRDQYARAEARMSELETMLEHSVPKAEFVDLMREVSILTNGPISDTEQMNNGEKSAPIQEVAPEQQLVTN